MQRTLSRDTLLKAHHKQCRLKLQVERFCVLRRRTCPHCDNLVSLKNFKTHKRRFYDTTNGRWLTTKDIDEEHDDAESPPCLVPEPVITSHLAEDTPGRVCITRVCKYACLLPASYPPHTRAHTHSCTHTHTHSHAQPLILCQKSYLSHLVIVRTQTITVKVCGLVKLLCKNHNGYYFL